MLQSHLWNLKYYNFKIKEQDLFSLQHIQRKKDKAEAEFRILVSTLVKASCSFLLSHILP